jgi:hypothetical protein
LRAAQEPALNEPLVVVDVFNNEVVLTPAKPFLRFLAPADDVVRKDTVAILRRNNGNRDAAMALMSKPPIDRGNAHGDSENGNEKRRPLTEWRR